MNKPEASPGRLAALLVGALGVVYGDIGTSPLYALRECFHAAHGLEANARDVLGILSLLIWSLVLIVSVKYLGVVMRADNRGEGGIMALLALAVSRLPGGKNGVLLAVGVFGSALLYGDGMITPAITVLGAIEGLKVVTPKFGEWVVPLSCGIIVVLFSVQRLGTGRIGSIFGPVMFVWFAVLAFLGVRGILAQPAVLAAFNPVHGVRFLWEHGGVAFAVLGSVFLALTGAEALYADMGHFGARPIRVAWFSVVFPALVLNYLGQGALVLGDPLAVENPFYLLAPGWARLPLVGLATAAAIIASQALISGVFSLTMQAMQLGYAPRLEIEHTSSTARGQIYLPQVNWALMCACLGLVVAFKSSNSLAAAYGIAVSLTMLATTFLLYFVARWVWGWSAGRALAVTLFFGFIEVAFFGANLLKFTHGGWFPLLVGGILYVCMATWYRGRGLVRDRVQAGALPLGMFLESMQRKPPVRVPGTAVFMTGNAEGTPGSLLHNLKHNKVLHERTVILRFATADSPYVVPEERVQVEQLPAGFFRVTGFFGFMEQPDMIEVRRACEVEGLTFQPMETTFFLGRETILPSARPGMSRWRQRLFSFMSRNATQATTFFQLPPNRVVELGMQVEV
ncbi:MAG: potassium transporter Kup [Limisphaerales bacterium]